MQLVTQELFIQNQKPNLPKNININNYSVEFTPTESHTGGTLFYINNKLSYKPRQNLSLYKSC